MNRSTRSLAASSAHTALLGAVISSLGYTRFADANLGAAGPNITGIVPEPGAPLSDLRKIDTRHTSDYKFVNRGLSNIGTDDAGPGAAITDDKKPEGGIDGDGTEQRAQQQAENAGGTQQANAADTTADAKTTVVGDPPAGSDQQQ